MIWPWRLIWRFCLYCCLCSPLGLPSYLHHLPNMWPKARDKIVTWVRGDSRVTFMSMISSSNGKVVQEIESNKNWPQILRIFQESAQFYWQTGHQPVFYHLDNKDTFALVFKRENDFSITNSYSFICQSFYFDSNLKNSKFSMRDLDFHIFHDNEASTASGLLNPWFSLVI